jgi:hypothetical protein
MGDWSNFERGQDCFEKSQNCCSTSDRTAELNSHLEDPVSTKIVRCELHKSGIHGRAAIAKPLKVMLRCLNNGDGVTTIKPGYQTSGNARVMWSDESSFTLFPMPGRVYVWRTPKEAYNPECLVPTVKHGGGSVVVLTAILWYSILSVPLLPFMAKLLQGSMRTNWVIRRIP